MICTEKIHLSSLVLLKWESRQFLIEKLLETQESGYVHQTTMVIKLVLNSQSRNKASWVEGNDSAPLRIKQAVKFILNLITLDPDIK